MKRGTRKPKPEKREITIDKHYWQLLEIMAKDDMRTIENLLEFIITQEQNRRYDEPNKQSAP
jgi:hypothetical protein